MRVVYNGIDLMAIQTHLMSFESIYDDSQTDYLYTRFTGSFRAYVSPHLVSVGPAVLSYGFKDSDYPVDTFSYRIPGRIIDPWATSTHLRNDYGNDPLTTNTLGDTSVIGPSQNAGINSGRGSPLRQIILTKNAPPLTLETIRHRLLTPRGKLYVFSGPNIEVPQNINLPTDRDPTTLRSEIGISDSVSKVYRAETGAVDPTTLTGSVRYLLLEAPEKGAICDPNNGPKPISLNIHTVTGDANFFVIDYMIEAYLIEDQLNRKKPCGPIISNRFSQTHQVSQEGYTSIITEGRAIFRADQLYREDSRINPDIFRPFLMMPIPHMFERENIVVRALPNVVGIEYSYVDRQRPVNFPAGSYVNASVIQAVHTQSIVTNADLAGSLIRLSDNLRTVRERDLERHDRRISREEREESRRMRKRMEETVEWEQQKRVQRMKAEKRAAQKRMNRRRGGKT